jgi:molybdopterin-containing oxidoreductase family membrane subunit
MSIIVNIGMWFERFVIIVTSIHRDFLPSSWTMFHPTWVDIGVFIGTIGIFFTLFLLFARFFPVLALNELKSILKSSGENYKEGFGHGEGYWDKYGHHDHDDHEIGSENEESEE